MLIIISVCVMRELELELELEHRARRNIRTNAGSLEALMGESPWTATATALFPSFSIRDCIFEELWLFESVLCKVGEWL